MQPLSGKHVDAPKRAENIHIEMTNNFCLEVGPSSRVRITFCCNGSFTSSTAEKVRDGVAASSLTKLPFSPECLLSSL